ncbi:MAG: hypothetical protein KJ884_07525 [Gammaproteobacteria bacterium]|uniref:Uncharacterized protein n=1 Tax=viral metagenome TaxID=1070528 RepID=A0A6M3KYA6_9ZZZZ|nr:hypothetical protein [Gammaproteobacteria bacterium]
MTKRVNPLEELVEQGANALVQLVDDAPEETMPFGSVKLSNAEQVERYLAMRDDMQAWIALLSEQPAFDVFRYAIEMEARVHAES